MCLYWPFLCGLQLLMGIRFSAGLRGNFDASFDLEWRLQTADEPSGTPKKESNGTIPWKTKDGKEARCCCMTDFPDKCILLVGEELNLSVNPFKKIWGVRKRVCP